MKKFSRVSREWKEAVFGEEQLIIKVLVIADGDLTFIERDDFSLTLFCDVLEKSAAPWEKIEVVTAHRKPCNENTGAEIKAFRFDTLVSGVPIFSIDRYDQIWLFGYDGEDPKLGLAPTELEVITEFMNKGGGVFATGDHEDIGCAMCGDVPRVRKMRRWHFKRLCRNEIPAPSRNGSTRIDTLREGTNSGFQADDQKDAVPQEIRPKFRLNKDKTAAEPHELLATETFAITILPDHMHEGECVGPDEIRRRAPGDAEVEKDFPEGSDTKERVWPEVVAIASSAAGTFVPEEEIRPVDPRCYIVISAYDGHLVEHTHPSGAVSRLGRVVVDSSFHHFVNVNLSGFIKQRVPSQEFEIFARYFRNTLRYLLPPKKQRLYFLHLLRALRFSSPLLEEIKDLSPDKWEHVIYAGAVTRRVISENFSPTHARRCALAMISDLQPELRKELQDILDLSTRRKEADNKFFFLNTDAVLIAVLGQSILSLASNLPEARYEVSRKLTYLEAGGIRLHTLVTENLQQQVTQLQDRIGNLGQYLEHFSQIS